MRKEYNQKKNKKLINLFNGKALSSFTQCAIVSFIKARSKLLIIKTIFCHSELHYSVTFFQNKIYAYETCHQNLSTNSKLCQESEIK